MDVCSEVVDWLKRMGYDRSVTPESLRDIVNPCTAHVWKQLMQNARPKAEIEHIRKMLIINRMKKSRNGTQSASDAKVPGLEMYQKKQELERKLNEKRKELAERELKLEKIRTQNKMKQMMLENSEDKIKTNQRFAFLLKRKAEQLQSDISKVEELLNVTKNLTPCEAIDPKKKQSILETLNECAEKLEKLLQQKDSDSSASFKTLGESPELRDESVEAALKKLLHENNRETVWNVLQESNETALTELITNRQQESLDQENGLSLEEQTKLYGIHIREEITARKLEQSNQKLQTELQNRKKEFLQLMEASCDSPESFEKQKNLLERALKDASLTAEGEYLVNEISEQSLLLEGFNTDELDELERANLEIERKIAAKERGIQRKIDLMHCYHDSILNTRVDTIDLVHKLSQFSGDNASWTQPLLKRIVSKEITTFMDYPLGYNKSTTQDGKRIYYRNMCLDVTSTLDLDNLSNNQLEMVLKIVENPFKFPEAQTADIIAKINTVKFLQSLPQSSVVISEIDDVDVKEEETIAQSVLGKSKYMLSEINRTNDSSVKRRIMEMLRIWSETNFGDYVSEKRVFNSRSYKYYEKMFDDIRKKM